MEKKSYVVSESGVKVFSEYQDNITIDKDNPFRPIIKEVVERYLDCGNPRCGFARIRCPDCGEERLLYFSCRSRGFWTL